MNIQETIDRLLEAADTASEQLRQAFEYFIGLREEAEIEIDWRKKARLPRAERKSHKCNRMSGNGYKYHFRPVYLARGRC